MKKIIATVVCILMVLTLLTACSEFTQGIASGGSNKGIVKIGVTGPMTGDYGYQGLGYKAVAEIAAETYNEKGGAGGYTVEVVAYDDKNSGDEVAIIAEKLAEDSDVVGVVGSFTSGVCMVSGPIFQEYGVVNIASAGHAGYAAIGDYIFRNNYMVKVECTGILEAVRDTLGLKKVGILAIDTEWGKSTTETMVSLMPSMGLELMLDPLFVLEGNDDYSTYISQFENAGIEAAIVVGMPATFIPFAIQYRQLNPNIGLAGFGNLYDDSTLANGGEYVENVAMPVAYFNDTSDPEINAFIEAFKAKAGRNPNTLDAQAYGGAMMILEAVDKLKTNDL